MCEEMVPGDFWKIGNEIVIRLQPLVSPLLHELKVFVHYFFVPYRLLWVDWEKFITGDVNGEDASVIPRWSPGGVPAKGTLWDFMGFPLVNVAGLDRPLVFPVRAYEFIWNEYYRD